MSISPLPRSNNTNWLKFHKKHCNDILNSSYLTLLIGDSLIAGLSRYPNIWRRYFKPLNAINCGIGADRMQNVLWRSNNLPSSAFFQNAVILCGTNNIQRDSSEDIVDGILEIALSLKRKYHHLNIVVCGLLPRDVNWSVNHIFINETNDYLLYRCSLNDFNFIKPKDWTLHNGSLKPNLFYMDNLHLVEEGNMNLSESIINVIKPNKNILTESISISSKCFNHAADFNINDHHFPPLPCNMSVRKFVPSSERVYANSIHSCKPVTVSDVPGSKFVTTTRVHSCKPVCAKNARTSKPVTTSNARSCKPVCANYVRKSKPVTTSNVRKSIHITVSNTHTSKTICESKPVCGSIVRESKPVTTSNVYKSKYVSINNVRTSKPVCDSNVCVSKPFPVSNVCTSNAVSISNVRKNKPLSSKCQKNYLALMFYLSALFCEFLLLGMFSNNNFCLISNTEFVIKSTDTFYNVPNILCNNNSNFLQIIYSEDFNDFYARKPWYIFKNFGDLFFDVSYI